jgi:neopullulanase
VRELGDAVKVKRPAVRLLLALAAAGVAACGDGASTPGETRDCSFVAFYQSDSTALPQRVAVVGDFNDWNPDALAMAPTGQPGLYYAVLDPEPGWHTYRVWVDGETALDGFNPLTLLGDDDQEASAMRIPDCAAPGLEVRSLAATGSGLAAEVAFLRARGGAALDRGTLAATVDGAPAAATAGALDVIAVGASGLAAGKHRLRLAARDRDGAAAEALEVPFWTESQPFEWRDGLIYQIVVDRFRQGGGALRDDLPITSFHGGDLAGVTEAVVEGYFEELGANTLWVSPLYQNPEGVLPGHAGHESEAYHGYWPSQPRTVSARFGGEAALDALVAAAHARGLRVLMDLVPNHVHESHPYYQEHRWDGWFNHPDGDCICGAACSWGGFIEECWFDPFLPDLRWGYQPVVDQGTDDAVWWLDRFDLDGFRVDAVPMMPRLATRHLRDAVHRRLEGGGTPVYLVGETYTGTGGQPSIRYYLGPQGLSGQFDYPVMWALRAALGGTTTFVDLDAEVRRSAAAWEGSGAVMAPILGNHDVARLVSELNGDNLGAPWDAPPPAPTTDKPYELLALAWSFLLTQPGAPVIYYGDEIGMPGASDPDNRRDMRFGAAVTEREAAVRAHVARLGQARRCSAALRRGERRTLFVNENLYVYGRDAGDGTVALVALNLATVPRDVSLEVPADWSFVDGTPLADALGGAATVAGRTVTLTVAPRAAAVMLSESACVGE